MTVDQHDPVRTFVLVPERNLGHAIAHKLREDPAIQVIGVSTDPDKDAYWIYDADPDVIIADFQAGGLQFPGPAPRRKPRTATRSSSRSGKGLRCGPRTARP